MKSGWPQLPLDAVATVTRVFIVYAGFLVSAYWRSALPEIGLKCWLNHDLISRGATIAGASAY